MANVCYDVKNVDAGPYGSTMGELADLASLGILAWRPKKDLREVNTWR